MPFQEKAVNTSVDEFLEETRKRIVNACLPVIIMTRIDEASISSPTDIIVIIKKRYKIQMSPGTVYPVLYRLEREGKIKRTLNRRKMLYFLTSEGKETIGLLHQESIGNLVNQLLINKI